MKILLPAPRGTPLVSRRYWRVEETGSAAAGARGTIGDAGPGTEGQGSPRRSPEQSVEQDASRFGEGTSVGVSFSERSKYKKIDDEGIPDQALRIQFRIMGSFPWTQASGICKI